MQKLEEEEESRELREVQTPRPNSADVKETAKAESSSFRPIANFT